ncbi:MAG TPA: glycosyltransferase family 4 protein [Acidimicrobiales bacterium]|nr:glycosyltransferase family 4 protein [Acidimicrobiales bacterium]
MRITFVLPRRSEYAVGGYAVVYEHASRLARRGHAVRVTHIGRLDRRRPRDVIRQVAAVARPRPVAVAWREVDPAVCLLDFPVLTPAVYRHSDVVVATAWNTAAALGCRLGRRRTPPGAYLLQHHETWGGEERVNDTWRLPLAHIAVSSWLAELSLELAGVAAFRVPNAIDTDTFRIVRDPRTRPPHVAMLFHTAPWKGSRDGIEALRLAKERMPQLGATLFGTFERPSGLPEWIDYAFRADEATLLEIYNRSAVFLSPSHAEGFGLPLAESMACGAALVSTAIPGVADFARQGETALLVPPGRPAEMAGALCRLLADPTQRLRLAHAGARVVREELDWESSARKLEDALAATAARTARTAGTHRAAGRRR